MRARLSRADRDVIAIWLVSRCAVLALTWPAAFIMRASSGSAASWLSMWRNWDANWLRQIAQHGYFGIPGSSWHEAVAFFPGYPLVLAGVHLLIRQWAVSGLIISFIAGGVAVVTLGRITDLDYRQGAGGRAVLFLVTSPAAIFLAAAYTESLFLAFALPAWLAARQRRWVPAVLLAGVASVIRVNGLFVCAAIALEILLRADRRRLVALVMFVPALIPLGCVELYLRLRTGDWLAWQHAEAAGWQRQLTNPVDAFKTTWRAAFGGEFHAPLAFTFQLEIVAVAAGVLVTLALLAHRRWPEAVYTGLTIAALMTSIWYESVPRALLLLWPLWAGLAALTVRRAWIAGLYLAVSVPVAAAIAILYLNGSWAG